MPPPIPFVASGALAGVPPTCIVALMLEAFCVQLRLRRSCEVDLTALGKVEQAGWARTASMLHNRSISEAFKKTFH